METEVPAAKRTKQTTIEEKMETEVQGFKETAVEEKIEAEAPTVNDTNETTVEEKTK